MGRRSKKLEALAQTHPEVTSYEFCPIDRTHWLTLQHDFEDCGSIMGDTTEEVLYQFRFHLKYLEASPS